MEKQILLPSENCLSATQLSQYLKDECSHQEHRKIDLHLDQCAFCSDAVQGAITLPLSEFENMMNRESILQEISKKTLWLANPTTKIWVGVSAAASIAAIVLLTNNFFGNKPTQQPTADNTSVPTQIIDNQAIVADNSVTQNPNDAKLAAEKTTNAKTADEQTTTNEIVTQGNVSTASSLETVVVPVPTTVVVQPQVVAAQKDVAVGEDKTETYKKNTRTAEALPSPVMNSNVQVSNNTQMSTYSDASAKSDNDDVDNGDDSNSRSYNIGMQMYYAKRYQEAIKTFEKFAGEKGTKSEKQKAAWFLANAHLSVGNTPRAKQLLENIANGGGTYSNNAKTTLEKIQ